MSGTLCLPRPPRISRNGHNKWRSVQGHARPTESTRQTVHVAIPFYMDTITNSFGRPERMWGRVVANHGFVPALALQLDSVIHMYCAQTTAVNLDVAARRLARLADDRDLARHMGATAAASTAHLAWDTVIGQYVDLWSRLRDESRAAGPPRTPAAPGPSSAFAFLRDFAGYASATLSPDDRFLISRLGQSLRDGKATVSLYEHTDEFLDLKLMEQLLRQFASERTVADVTARLASEPGRSAVQVSQNILWLYKYGYLTALNPPVNSRGRAS